VLDGCIYIVGFVSAPGEITQMGQIFNLLYGARPNQNVDQARLQAINNDLIDSGIKAQISDDIDRDTFTKWSYISAMAVTGAYYDVPMGEVQKPGPIRDTFIALSRESIALGEKLGIHFNQDMIAHNLRILDSLDPHSTASMQKDMARGHQSEVQGLFFDIIDLARQHGVDTPTYHRLAPKFQ
jgi:2-dehydropantoate 2-reductase